MTKQDKINELRDSKIESLLLYISNLPRGVGYTEALYHGVNNTNRDAKICTMHDYPDKEVTLNLSDPNFVEKLKGVRFPLLLDKEVIPEIVGYCSRQMKKMYLKGVEDAKK